LRVEPKWGNLKAAEEGVIGMVTSDRNTSVHLPRHVLQSWTRCHGRALSPSAFPPPCLPRRDLERLLAAHAELLELSHPILVDLAGRLRGTPCAIALADAAGRLLKTAGEPLPGLLPGSDWSEAGAGTNGLGLALLDQVPVAVTGNEHYIEALQTLTTCGAPLFASGGTAAGALALFGPAPAVDRLCLGLVAMAARALEAQLALRDSAAAVQRAESTLLSAMGAVSDAVLVARRDGVVTAANHRARELLAQPAYEPEWEMARAMGEQHPVIVSLATGTPVQDEPVRLATAGGTRWLLFSVRPVLSDGAPCGQSVVTIRPEDGHHSHPRAGQARYTLDDIVGVSPEMQQVKLSARRAAESELNVLLLGESGTGKELLAHGIHNASGRRDGPFVALNGMAIPRTLLESELFGYAAGAFTGADRRGRPGKFELADGGTLFLDEIGDMPFEMQGALLRILQDHEVLRLSGTRSTAVDVRVIAATNKDLSAEVKAGNFRSDLLYRLDVLTVKVPPLRERPADVVPLVEHFLARKGLPLGCLAPEVVERLLLYPWPGNVRELFNVLEKCLVQAGGAPIRLEHLPHDLRGDAAAVRDGSRMDDLERVALADALRLCDGNLSQAARHLGISRPTLYRKLRRYGLPGRSGE
jgi:transcriptional regulator of acetoin/glycerol metabolism